MTLASCRAGITLLFGPCDVSFFPQCIQKQRTGFLFLIRAKSCLLDSVALLVAGQCCVKVRQCPAKGENDGKRVNATENEVRNDRARADAHAVHTPFSSECLTDSFFCFFLSLPLLLLRSPELFSFHLMPISNWNEKATRGQPPWSTSRFPKFPPGGAGLGTDLDRLGVRPNWTWGQGSDLVPFFLDKLNR